MGVHTCLSLLVISIVFLQSGVRGEGYDIDCASDPCQNGGICTDIVNGYTCVCAPGYEGDNCETDIDECASDPCQNGGTCTNLVNGYTCDCAEGYEGDNCDTGCPPTTPLPTDFSFEAARSAYTELAGTLGPAVSEEVGLDTFRSDLSAYAEYDGTPLADLPDTANITIQPERWALTYTDPGTPGVTTALFLPETTDFDPNVGLPDNLPNYALDGFRQRYPRYYALYLTNISTNYANSRASMEFDPATYGPDADCPYPSRTDLGGGFALRRVPPTLCRPNDRITVDDRKVTFSVDVIRDVSEDEIGVDITEEVIIPPPPPTGCRTDPPSYSCVTVQQCTSTAPYNNGDSCEYQCAPGCNGQASTTVTCNNGIWDGQVPFCWGCKTGPPDYPPCIETVCLTRPPYNNGYTCGYRCARNCTGPVSTFVTCENGIWDGTVPYCKPVEPIYCRSPPDFDCTTRTGCSAPYTEGETCTYRCNETCTGTPSVMTRTCIQGMWKGDTWTGCREHCRDPPSFECTVRSGCDSPYTNGEVCAYECDMYRGCCGVPDSTTRECVDGTWIGPAWRGCNSFRECGPPPNRFWASYTCDSPGAPFCSGTKCTYKCSPGCAAIPATATATCRNGKWYGRKKWKCKKGCGEPPDLPCTKMAGCAPSPFHSVLRYDYGASCSYRCYKEDGYAMEVSGDPIRTCLRSGLWSGTDLVCDCKDRKDCCRPDIIFVLDYSGSMAGDIGQMIDFVEKLVELFDIGDLDARVGILRYNNLIPIMPVIQLNTYDSKAALIAAISSLPTTAWGWTYTGAALTYVTNTMLLPVNGNRGDAPDVVIVLTDGFSGDSVTGPASVLHNMGVQTFAIGVGDCMNDTQLHDIASCDDYVYKLGDFRRLGGITDIIHKQICCDKRKLQAAEDVCPPDYERVMVNGPCLRFSAEDDTRTYEDARQTCREEGARLVVIKSAAFDSSIDDRIRNTYDDVTWIGLEDPAANLQFVWSDGSTLQAGDYSDWSPINNQPDALGEKCVEIRPRVGNIDFNYQWNNHWCQLRKNYICEIVARPPCCPRPKAPMSNPGYAVSSNGTYTLSPAVPCDQPTEVQITPPDDDEVLDDTLDEQA